jgi:hypothetical protein
MLSCRALRLQQLQYQQLKQRQKPDEVPDNAAGSQAMAGATTGAVATAATTPGGDGLALLLAQSDLTCEVNRWDLVQRGTCDS